ncbi:11597_t:CDS:2 [Ambispora leptoticha]|uniref:11597_t:CDS:1 n=1 Tax=Ambispora leptoticha TaxID=144679 RepID=A0A9N9AW89_9GLOM|nr:11597_t:CDS:2 [Ambispora leptoticha]
MNQSHVVSSHEVAISGSNLTPELLNLTLSQNDAIMHDIGANIILEREKRNAGKNYVIEGVKVLNEARFSSSDEVISTINKRHPEVQASGNEDASYKRQSLQIEKVNNEPPRTPEHQIYQPEQNQRRTRTGKKVGGYYELGSNLSEEDDDYNKDNVENKKTGPFPLTEEHRQIIEQTFNGMKKERMWRLSTGKYVEEELFELGKKLKFEHAVHSFILDVDDGIINQHFNEAELDEIDYAPGPQVPELSEEITGFLNKFVDKVILHLYVTDKDICTATIYQSLFLL